MTAASVDEIDLDVGETIDGAGFEQVGEVRGEPGITTSVSGIAEPAVVFEHLGTVGVSINPVYSRPE